MRGQLETMREQRNQSLENLTKSFACPICKENTVNCTLEPCGHMLCQDCCIKVDTCPLCREMKTDHFHTHLPLPEDIKRNPYMSPEQMYRKGKGISDMEEQFFYYKDAAKNGNAKACYLTGVFYHLGLGNVRKDESQAKLWMTIAANHGHIAAKKWLASFYWRKKEFEDSAKWARRALDNYDSALIPLPEVVSDDEFPEDNE